LLDLLERLGVKDPVHLVGFSFGGATATNFTAVHPDKVRTLALIAPVFRFEEGNSLMRAARIPLVGELFMRFVMMKKGADRASRLWSGAEGTERYAALFATSSAGQASSRLSILPAEATPWGTTPLHIATWVRRGVRRF
jgi:pimeloyl-ACP methyl ester carboxylesterase